MAWVAVAIGGSAVVGAYTSNKAAKTQARSIDAAGQIQEDAAIRAAEIQAASARESAQIQQRIADQQMALEREQFNRQLALQEGQFNRQVELQQPWHTAGKNALTQLVPLASNYTPFGMEQFQADPGYSFRMDEGMKALERSAAARGGLLSGGMMKGIQRFGQGLASDEYTNAFNRYQVERNARLNPLQSLAGMGQTSAGQIGQAGQAMTSGIGQAGQAMTSGIGQAGQSLASGMTGINQNMANNLTNINQNAASNAANTVSNTAQARASGYVGQANALTSALNTGLNYYQSQQLMNMLKPSMVLGGS